MNWTIAIADALVLLGAAIIFIWRLSDANRRMLNMEEKQREHHEDDNKRFSTLEHQMQRQRDWKHDKANPVLQDHEYRITEMEGGRRPHRSAPKLEWTDEDDSRVTSDPRKEPIK